ncbi:MAG: hypothetical protein V4463_06150 [Pseudomonadota bacterium]
MQQLRISMAMAAATVVAYLLMLALNEWLFANSTFVPGIHWVYLPAGLRLLCTLLFGGAGAIGLLCASFLVSFYGNFPGDLERSLGGAILTSLVPYACYQVAQMAFGLRSSLANLSATQLLACALIFSLANPLLHHAWFVLRGDHVDLARSFVVMFVGDLSGTLLLLYGVKTVLYFLPEPQR